MVIDPLSMFSFSMYRRFVELKPCFANPSAAIVLMTPFRADPTLSFLRESLLEYIRPNLEWYCEPIPFQPAYANCGINVSEPWEIRRLLLASLGRQPAGANHLRVIPTLLHKSEPAHMIYTFYSYKGGVGRSMALANIAECFCAQGLRVLMIDWDLEAPGLESFFFEQQTPDGDSSDSGRHSTGAVEARHHRHADRVQALLLQLAASLHARSNVGAGGIPRGC